MAPPVTHVNASALAEALGDRYTLERELGRGGMATVFLARDPKHQRLVALKLMDPELAVRVGPARFLQEIRVTARLQHPHILPLLESGEVNRVPYYVMPYVEGESLRSRLRREKQLPVEDAVRIATEVALALDYAHGAGIVHRDIKPENILLSQGQALVADFGVARAVEAAGAERLTATGLSVGTPAYMSPEQALGDADLDGRSDLYSLGCVLYEMLVGAPPFSGPSARAVVARHSVDPMPSIRAVRPTVSDGVEQAVRRSMAKVPADRFATGADFAEALAAADRAVIRASRRAWGKAAGLLVVLGIGLMVAAAWLTLPRQRSSAPSKAPAGKVLAVLPFENFGSTGDEYFADGISDEVRSRLSSIPGVQVIARRSSTEYRHTTKLPQQIARELGVNYLLTATVRWEADSGQPRKVHVSPELIQVVGNTAPRATWQAPFVEPVTNVFQAYASIATDVAKALDLQMSDSTRLHLARRPTRNAAAYEAYLQGEADGLGRTDPRTLRDALPHYARAVGLDSTFAEAWARLSQIYVLLYSNATPSAEFARLARLGAERALAIAPDEPGSHLAMGLYREKVTGDIAGATTEYDAALKLRPDNPEALGNIAEIEEIAGRWDQAIAHFQRAQLVEPRSAGVALNLAIAMLWVRRYPEAERAMERTLALDPNHLPAIEMAAMIDAAQGNLPAARARIAQAPQSVDRDALAAQFAMYWDLVWMLDESQQQGILRTTPSAYSDDRGIWGLIMAQTLWLHGERGLAARYADSARATLADHVRENPDDDQQHLLLGLSLAYLGRKDAAIREGLRGLALAPMSGNGLYGAYDQHLLTRIYLLVGERDEAIKALQRLLQVPYFLSPGWLRIDPTFEPLRGDPRFERLIAGVRSQR